jgi:hypothetical protein
MGNCCKKKTDEHEIVKNHKDKECDTHNHPE